MSRLKFIAILLLVSGLAISGVRDTKTEVKSKEIEKRERFKLEQEAERARKAMERAAMASELVSEESLAIEYLSEVFEHAETRAGQAYGIAGGIAEAASRKDPTSVEFAKAFAKNIGEAPEKGVKDYVEEALSKTARELGKDEEAIRNKCDR